MLFVEKCSVFSIQKKGKMNIIILPFLILYHCSKNTINHKPNTDNSLIFFIRYDIKTDLEFIIDIIIFQIVKEFSGFKTDIELSTIYGKGFC